LRFAASIEASRRAKPPIRPASARQTRAANRSLRRRRELPARAKTPSSSRANRQTRAKRRSAVWSGKRCFAASARSVWLVRVLFEFAVRDSAESARERDLIAERRDAFV